MSIITTSFPVLAAKSVTDGGTGSEVSGVAEITEIAGCDPLPLSAVYILSEAFAAKEPEEISTGFAETELPDIKTKVITNNTRQLQANTAIPLLDFPGSGYLVPA